MGMAHRGRLNVLVNTLGKMPSELFQEFEGKAHTDLPSGDVKYHQGFSSDVVTPGGPVHLTLAFNPRIWKSSIRWWKAACAPGSSAAATVWATRCCRC